MTSTIRSAAQADLPEDLTGVKTPETVTVEVGPMAHGGHCVARHEGRVIFVRHAIPGEIVVAQLTETGDKARYWRGDVVEIIRASEFRRSHQWKLADSLRAYHAGRQPIGGAEYGHIVLEHQRRLKAHVFRDTLSRIGKQTIEAGVIGLESDEPTGLHWRTRNAFAVTSSGRIAMHVHRSMTTIPVRNIPLAVSALDDLHLWDIDFTGADRVEVATPSTGDEALIIVIPSKDTAAQDARLNECIKRWKKQLSAYPESVSAVVAVEPEKLGGPIELTRLRGRTWVKEVVASSNHGSKTFRVSGPGFWQVHRDAPATLVDAVMAAASPQPGEVVADLYAGAGLFSAFLADAVGEDGCVLSVEASAGASRDARRNLHSTPQAYVLNGRTDRVVGSWINRPEAPLNRGGLDGRSVDTVVLDPPRSGAGKAAVQRIHQLAPTKIVYVSCDPASFARDTRWLGELGWSLDSADVYDLYPDTHHMESVAVFTRAE